MGILADLFGIGYRDPRLESDSEDYTTATLRAAAAEVPDGPRELDRGTLTPWRRVEGGPDEWAMPAAAQAVIDAAKRLAQNMGAPGGMVPPSAMSDEAQGVLMGDAGAATGLMATGGLGRAALQPAGIELGAAGGRAAPLSNAGGAVLRGVPEPQQMPLPLEGGQAPIRAPAAAVPREAPGPATQPELPLEPWQRPRTLAEAMRQGGPFPDRDPAKYPIKGPVQRGGGSLDALEARMKEAEQVAAEIRAMGHAANIKISGPDNSVYLQVPQKNPADLTAPGDFKARFSDHAAARWHSISADPASGNTPGDVMRAFRHHVGEDPTPPEVGWSQIGKPSRNGAAQRGGIGVYDRDFRKKGETMPIRRTIRLFADGSPMPAAAQGPDVTTEDVIAYLQQMGAR